MSLSIFLLACCVQAAGAVYDVFSASLTELGSSGVTGEVTVFVTSTGLLGVGSASGLEANLTSVSNCTASNGCGVHVHSGTSCTNSTTQGGHYYTASTSDPWATVGYPGTSSAGAATFSFSVTTADRDIANKAFVVHNNAGARVACGILGEATGGAKSATLAPLDGSGVTGDVTIYTTTVKIIGAGQASGLEASLSDASNGGTNCTATNGCGAHVHSGTACTNATTQGGHYYAAGTADPWAPISYSMTSSAGGATFTFSVTASERVIANKTFVVHNNAGGRVACGLLGTTTGSTTGSTSGPMSGSTSSSTASTTSSTTGSSNVGSTSAAVSSSMFSIVAMLFAGMLSMAAEL